MAQRAISDDEYNAIKAKVLAAAPPNLNEHDFELYIKPAMAAAMGEAENSPTPVEGSAVGRFASGLGSMLNPVAAVKGAYDVISHPVDTVVRVAKSHKEQFDKAGQAFREGRTLEGLGHGAAGLLPVVGPAAAGIGERMAETGDIATGVGEGVGLALASSPRNVTAGVKKVGGLAADIAAPAVAAAKPTVMKVAASPLTKGAVRTGTAGVGAWLGGPMGAGWGAHVGDILAKKLPTAPSAPAVVNTGGALAGKASSFADEMAGAVRSGVDEAQAARAAAAKTTLPPAPELPAGYAPRTSATPVPTRLEDIGKAPANNSLGRLVEPPAPQSAAPTTLSVETPPPISATPDVRGGEGVAPRLGPNGQPLKTRYQTGNPGSADVWTPPDNLSPLQRELAKRGGGGADAPATGLPTPTGKVPSPDRLGGQTAASYPYIDSEGNPVRIDVNAPAEDIVGSVRARSAGEPAAPASSQPAAPAAPVRGTYPKAVTPQAMVDQLAKDGVTPEAIAQMQAAYDNAFWKTATRPARVSAGRRRWELSKIIEDARKKAGL